MTTHPVQLDFETSLDKLAQVGVEIGIRLVPGQELVVVAPIEALPLARRITDAAYRAGASLVTTFYEDEAAMLSRFRYGHDKSFDSAAGWLYEAMGTAAEAGAARLEIIGGNPALLADQDPEKIARFNLALTKAYMTKPIGEFSINWTVLAYATRSWARAVFPQDAPDIAIAKLWEAIFAASRADVGDPTAAWNAHNANLNRRREHLNAKKFAALHFTGPGTDLRVGLADLHEWCGGAARAQNGIICNPNIPTEEVFTTPHKDRVNGILRSTKPLSYGGTLIEEISVRFENGRIVEADAAVGVEVLRGILNTDEGSSRLGEVALVPYSSPISKSGLLFFNTLFDENAASHVAVGQALLRCFRNRETMNEEEFEAQGGNRSLLHVDWMIGSREIDVDGITVDGHPEPLMRAGEWAI